jgi:hypothetical protein
MEKSFEQQIGNIESDYYDRFLHYHCVTLLEQYGELLELQIESNGLYNHCFNLSR